MRVSSAYGVQSTDFSRAFFTLLAPNRSPTKVGILNTRTGYGLALEANSSISFCALIPGLTTASFCDQS